MTPLGSSWLFLPQRLVQDSPNDGGEKKKGASDLYDVDDDDDDDVDDGDDDDYDGYDGGEKEKGPSIFYEENIKKKHLQRLRYIIKIIGS